MTYKDAFVVEVKCKGKILRMRDDFVHLPFGSEYSIYLKNLSSRKASVKIHVDGQDVLDYSSLILNANSSTELEGFLSGSVARNKFKFIQKTKEVQDHRGDKIDDGMIRVEFAYEKAKPEVRQIITERHEHHYHNYDYYHWWPRWTTFKSPDDMCGTAGLVDSVTYTSSMGAMNIQATNSMGEASEGEVRACFSNVVQDSLGVESLGQPLADEGITVKGSEIHQQFRYGSIGELDPSEVIVIRMKGIDDTSSAPVQAPLTVQTKLTCSSCGKTFKSSYKYCPNCGTYLE